MCSRGHFPVVHTSGGDSSATAPVCHELGLMEHFQFSFDNLLPWQQNGGMERGEWPCYLFFSVIIILGDPSENSSYLTQRCKQQNKKEPFPKGSKFKNDLCTFSICCKISFSFPIILIRPSFIPSSRTLRGRCLDKLTTPVSCGWHHALPAGLSTIIQLVPQHIMAQKLAILRNYYKKNPKKNLPKT